MGIRNFCIIAHIDHGKSTLADRFIELTATMLKRDMKHGQLLDSMDLEQERGITIKLAPVRMEYVHKGQKYILNLIDTPGHVDFAYEVSRSLACCEGAILVVDATQGIQAQTLANAYQAIDHNLHIIPVINKIDLPAADTDRVAMEIEKTLGLPAESAIPISAKEGTNVEEVLRRVIETVPPPKKPHDTENGAGLRALIFDSLYDSYRGVVVYLRVFEGSVKKGDKMKFIHTGKEIEVIEVGYFRPKLVEAKAIHEGEVGYVVTGLKSVGEARVGDTLIPVNSKIKALPGYKKVTPFVYSSIFCIEGEKYRFLRDAVEKLQLNDSSFTFEPEQSAALGHGFRCGFLGLLHMEIVQERLEREFGLELFVTAPSVSYRITSVRGEVQEISSPMDLPDRSFFTDIAEPFMKIELLAPAEYLGKMMEIIQSRRGVQKNLEYLDASRVLLAAEMPLSEIIVDFYDELKSATKGYASMNYEFLEYRSSDLVKLDVLIAGEKVDPLSAIVHRSEAFYRGSDLAKKLKELIPRQQFEIPIQAAIGAKIIARETIGALRKNVTEKLYGGDRTRKDKLLKKQKAGKKRMKQFGKVDLPQEAFFAILKRSN